MKMNIYFIAILFLFASQNAQSKEKDHTHNFKIVGAKKVALPSPSQGKKTVEYDPESNNHLFISDYDKSGKIVSKRQFLFTGKKFSLSHNYIDYVNKKEIVTDGSHTFYKDGSIHRLMNYSHGELLDQISFYPNGQKQSMIPGLDVLNGEYKMWHQNGQLSFTGIYNNNLKDGEFQLFDESGTSIMKGVYQEGKLVSGEPVIQDMVFRNPDVPAKFKTGEAAFDEYLTRKASEIEALKVIYGSRKIYLDIITDKTGKITGVQNISGAAKGESESINAIFKDCPELSPATVENIPVQSVQKMALTFSNEGIKIRPDEDVMPQFPGGPEALKQYLATSIIYPSEALNARIQGKVTVRFVVNIDGEVVDVGIDRGIHPALDAEAVRIVRMMPKWTPGRQDGKNVNVALAVPINFVSLGIINKFP
jgi:TonB family protein